MVFSVEFMDCFVMLVYKCDVVMIMVVFSVVVFFKIEEDVFIFLVIGLEVG